VRRLLVVPSVAQQVVTQEDVDVIFVVVLTAIGSGSTGRLTDTMGCSPWTNLDSNKGGQNDRA